MKKAISVCEGDNVAERLSLSATEMGAPLYAGLGFVYQPQRMTHLAIPAVKLTQAISKEKREDGNSSITFEHFDSDSDPERWDKGLVLAGSAGDRDLHQTVNRWIAPKGTKRGVFAVDKNNSRVIGFGAMRPYGVYDWHIGPITASTSAVARDVFRQLVESTQKLPHASGDGRIAVSAKSNSPDDAGWVEWLKDLGIEVIMDCPIMIYDVKRSGEALSQQKPAATPTDVFEWGYVDPGSV